MRRVPILAPTGRDCKLRVNPKTQREVAALTEALNVATKPHGFPHTVPGKKTKARPFTVSQHATAAACVAVILDMLDSGKITHGSLLRRMARFEDIDPIEAERIATEKAIREQFSG